MEIKTEQQNAPEKRMIMKKKPLKKNEESFKQSPISISELVFTKERFTTQGVHLYLNSWDFQCIRN